LIAEEEGTVIKGWGGKISVCLIYPNSYHAGMSNLGFQTVYGHLNRQFDVVCERAFLPDSRELAEYRGGRSSLLSCETQRPLSDFDVIAFSVSFETDYLNIPRILDLARISSFSAGRTSSDPLVIGGGAALFLNPEPVAEFLDMICVGEAEVIIPGLLELLRDSAGLERAGMLAEAALLPGIYVPSLYEIEYDGQSVAAIKPKQPQPPCVSRAWCEDLDAMRTGSEIFTPATEFSGIHLLELSRGCPRGCRFCAAGFIYAPYRQRSLDSMRKQAMEALSDGRKIGLVGAAVGDFKGIGELCRDIGAAGGRVTVASLRIDALDEEMVRVLVASGHKTISLAPEGPSQRLRNLVRKGIDTSQILSACERLIEYDILNLKLYFIIGLPTENMADLEEMAELVDEIRRLVTDKGRANRRLGQVTLSVNPFVPKPFTPFQWCGMTPLAELGKRADFLRQALGKMPNVRLQVEGLKDASLQALLARGDRRLAGMLASAGTTGNWRRAARDSGIDVEAAACRSIPLDEVLPWDVICCQDRQRLESEYKRAFCGG
jgi:radical SAM superfamily enzyme YgiQ (UPF0313 family)